MLDDVITFLLILLSFGMVTFWGWVTLAIARRRHRSPLWFVAGLLGSFLAAGLVALLPDLKQSCPRCKAPFHVGEAHCSQCGVELPGPDTIARLGGDIGRFDQQCPTCRRPYSLSDYRPDALEILCSWCKAPLPRDPAPARAQEISASEWRARERREQGT